LSELNKIEVRNYKEHSILREIAFSVQFLEGIRTFRYCVVGESVKESVSQQSYYYDKG